MDPQSNTPTKPNRNNYYPQIEIERNTSPNRLYAIPLFGFLAKIIILIPIYIELWILIILTGIVVILINPFSILFTGKYLQMAYDLATGVMRLGIKSGFYLYGIIDKYPGFSISTTPFTWSLAYPESPNKLYAIPILGFLIRAILIIPFSIFSQIISYTASIAVFVIVTPLSVLIKGYYPETTHELAVDSVRLSHASMAYMFGLSDKYPSFKISWNHKTMKIILMVIGTLALLGNFMSGLSSPSKTKTLPNFPSPTINQIDLPAAQSF